MAPAQGDVDPVTAAVDIAVVPQPTAGQPGTHLASWQGCPLVVPAELEQAPPNPAGLCDLSLQPLIEQALAGDGPVAPSLDALVG